MISLY